MDRLTEIRERRAKATPGEWHTAATDDSLVLAGRQKIASMYEVPGDYWGVANAAFIAAAPSDIDWLIARVEALSAGLRVIRATDPGKASAQSLAHEMALIAAQALLSRKDDQ